MTLRDSLPGYEYEVYLSGGISIPGGWQTRHQVDRRLLFQFRCHVDLHSESDDDDRNVRDIKYNKLDVTMLLLNHNVSNFFCLVYFVLNFCSRVFNFRAMADYDITNIIMLFVFLYIIK